jgi:hypothetical protein
MYISNLVRITRFHVVSLTDVHHTWSYVVTGHHNETSGARLVDFLLENIFTNHDKYVVNKINWSNLMKPVSENFFLVRIRILLSITKQ